MMSWEVFIKKEKYNVFSIFYSFVKNSLYLQSVSFSVEILLPIGDKSVIFNKKWLNG